MLKPTEMISRKDLQDLLETLKLLPDCSDIISELYYILDQAEITDNMILSLKSTILDSMPHRPLMSMMTFAKIVVRCQ